MTMKHTIIVLSVTSQLSVWPKWGVMVRNSLDLPAERQSAQRLCCLSEYQKKREDALDVNEQSKFDAEHTVRCDTNHELFPPSWW